MIVVMRPTPVRKHEDLPALLEMQKEPAVQLYVLRRWAMGTRERLHQPRMPDEHFEAVARELATLLDSLDRIIGEVVGVITLTPETIHLLSIVAFAREDHRLAHKRLKGIIHEGFAVHTMRGPGDELLDLVEEAARHLRAALTCEGGPDGSD